MHAKFYEKLLRKPPTAEPRKNEREFKKGWM
jgi:hypothetical protein